MKKFEVLLRAEYSMTVEVGDDEGSVEAEEKALEAIDDLADEMLDNFEVIEIIEEV